jgi:hypothetical protein
MVTLLCPGEEETTQSEREFKVMLSNFPCSPCVKSINSPIQHRYNIELMISCKTKAINGLITPTELY